jgi:hypothetical protein
MVKDLLQTIYVHDFAVLLLPHKTEFSYSADIEAVVNRGVDITFSNLPV